MSTSAWSRRPPWPYDLRLGGPAGLGLMLRSGEDGQLVATKSKPLDAAPVTYQYESQQPFLERTHLWKELYDGMGQQVQPEGRPRRSHYAINIDTSLGGTAMLGPLFHPETVADGKAIRQIVVGLHGGVPALFALAGDTVARRTADATWVNSLTLAGASQAQQATRFAPGGRLAGRVEIASPEVLPPATATKPYNYRLAARGGSGTYTWWITSGSLPNNMVLSSAGVISGTPTAAEAARPVSLHAIDSNGVVNGRAFTLEVTTATQPLAVDTVTPLPDGQIGVLYSTQLNARGGSGPYTWAITAGTLPAGLTLNASTGVISGTPTTATASPTPTVTVQATDAVAATTTRALALRVRTADTDYLYVASSASNLYAYDGAAWRLASATEGPPEGQARFIAAVEDELFVGWGTKVAKAEADPIERGSWAGAIDLGGAPVTWLTGLENFLVAFKEDGVFTLNKDGTSQQIFPAAAGRVAFNGRNAAVWLNEVWAPVGNAFYRMSADGVFTPSGTEQLLENASEVRGRIVASSGHNAWHNYEVIYGTNGHSYLGKFGAWIESEDKAQSTFRAAHHFAIKKWASKEATCAQIVSASDLGTTNDRLYVGFADGTVEWCVLPRFNPNPSGDPNVEFTDQPGYLHFPLFTANFPADIKSIRGFSVIGPSLGNYLPARILYRVDQAAGFTTLSDANGAPVTFTGDGQRFDVPDTVLGRNTEVALHLWREVASTSANQTPIVHGVAIHAQVRPAFLLEWTFNVDARAAVARHDGTAERRSPDQIRDALRTACAAYGSQDLVLPDGSVEEVGYIDFREALKAYDKRYGLAWEFSLRAMQYRTLSNPALITGLTYGQMETYTYGSLEGIL